MRSYSSHRQQHLVVAIGLGEDGPRDIRLELRVLVDDLDLLALDLAGAAGGVFDAKFEPRLGLFRERLEGVAGNSVNERDLDGVLGPGAAGQANRQHGCAEPFQNGCHGFLPHDDAESSGALRHPFRLDIFR